MTAGWRLLWRAYRRNGGAHPAFYWVVMPLLALGVLVQVWSATGAWRSDPGSLAAKAALASAGFALAVAAHSALATFRSAFDGRAQSRLSLPLPPARLLRLALLANAADLTILAVMAASAAVVSLIQTGPMILIWWAAAVLGTPFWMWCGFMAALSLADRPWAAPLGLSAAAALWWSGVAESAAGLDWSLPTVGAAASAVAPIASAVVIGPLASWSGRRYRAFLEVSRRGRRRRGFAQRFGGLFAPLRSWRGPVGALLFRGSLLESRSGFAWCRVALAGASPVILSVIDLPVHWPAFAQPWGPGFAGVALVWGLFIFDGCTSPFGAEGSRLQLFMSAPLAARRLLYSKAAVFFLASAVATLPLVSGLLAVDGRAPRAWGESELVAVALLAGLTVIYVAGSSLEADPAQAIPEGVAGRLFEEAPLTGVRMALAAAGAAYLATAAWLLPMLPVSWAAGPAVLFGVDLALAALMVPAAVKRLSELSRAAAG